MKTSSNKNIVMIKAIDLSHIYSLRNNFTIIGLTGQIGSGCSEVAEQLSIGFRYADFEDPLEIGLSRDTSEFKHNSYRKYRIVYKYAVDNFKSYSRINYKDVLVIFLLQNSFEAFIRFLNSTELNLEFHTLFPNVNFEEEIQALITLKPRFEALSKKFQAIKIQEIKDNNNWNELYKFYFDDPEFHSFCDSIHAALKEKSRVKRNKLLQIIST